MSHQEIGKTWDNFYKRDEFETIGGKEMSQEYKEQGEAYLNFVYEERRKLLPMLNVHPGLTFLDIGCGSLGTLTIPAIEHGCKVTSIDISPTAVQLLKTRIKQRHLQADVQTGDVLNGLQFRNETFDYVFSLYVVQHILEPKRFLDELTRITKKGGTIYINSYMNKWHPLHWERRALRKTYELVMQKRWWSPMGTVDKSELLRIYKDLGLKITSFQIQNKEAYLPLRGLIPYPNKVVRSIDKHVGIEQAYAIVAIKL